MKKWILCILIVATVFSFTACSSSSSSPNSGGGSSLDINSFFKNKKSDSENTSSTGLAYKINADGKTCTITGIGTYKDEDLIIPSVINGYRVTKIGNAAFSGCQDIQTITIPDGITDIGTIAFSASLFTNIRIPDSIEYIGGYALSEGEGFGDFAKTVEYKNGYYLGNEKNPYTVLISVKDPSITSFEIPKTTKVIYDCAFWRCENLASITIPDSVTCIGWGAFGYCSSLTNVTIGNGVKSIGDGAFGDCKNIANIIIPDSLTSIDPLAFSECEKLQYNRYDNGYYLGNKKNPYMALIKITENDSVTSCKIHQSTKMIACSDSYGYGFSIPRDISITVDTGNTNYHIAGNCLIETQSKTLILGLPNSVIPADGSVTSIGNFAFNGYEHFTDLILPDHITNIGNAAFAGCNFINLTIPDSVTNIGDGAFMGCSNLKNITLPNSITNIGSFAFCQCNSLTDITIPNSVMNIGSQAFDRCDSLTNIEIPDSVTSIGSYAFSRCYSLINIVIPDSVTSISSYAFSGCGRLTSIVIPDSVIKIGEEAFYLCESLTNITFKGTKAQWDEIVRNDSISNCVIHCTNGDIPATDNTSK